MLQDIRERFTGVFAIVLLGMLGISFVFFGIGNFNFLNTGNAAVVEGVEISTGQLENAYQNQLLQLPNYGDLPPSTLQLIKSSILERLVRDTLIEVYVAENGFRVSDEQVAGLIQSEPQFQENGVFQKQLYYNWLEQVVVDPQVFENQQRRAMRTSQFQRGIGATAFVTPTEYRRYLNLLAEQRQVSVATFDIAALADTVVVKEEDIIAYYEARPDEFLSPETVDFEYLEIDRAALGDEIDVTEDELQQYYESNASRFRQDERRRASHILVPADDDEDAATEQARALVARAQAGEPFADLARQYSKDGGTAGQGGDLGTMLQSQMPGALGDAIFSMDQGEIYGPVRTDFGFHVVKLDEIVPGGPLPMAEVRDELLGELRAGRVDERFRELERQVSDALFDADDLQTIAAGTGLDVQTATGFTRSGGEPFGGNQTMIDAVFDPLVLNDGQPSDVLEIDANRAVMVKVTNYHEESRMPLEEVRADIEFSLQSARALNMVEDRGRRLREALREGAEFAQVAEQLEARFTPDLVVNRRQEDIDGSVLDAVFRAKKPSPGKARLGSTLTTTGDFAVFLVKAVLPGRPESIPLAERDQRKEELQMTAGAADFNAFVNELQRNADIERSENALDEPDLLR